MNDDDRCEIETNSHWPGCSLPEQSEVEMAQLGELEQLDGHEWEDDAEPQQHHLGTRGERSAERKLPGS